MNASKPLTFLCVSCYFKGVDFLRAAASAGVRVYLLTAGNLKNEAWPRDILEDIFFVEESDDTNWDMDSLAMDLATFLRHNHVDRFIALDEFDVERVAFLREVFRVPGMGSTTTRYFRDKLAMRMKAAENNIPIPPFVSTFNDEEINAYATQYEAPWLIKPRSQASATGIQKVRTHDELWEKIHLLESYRHEYLIEKFSPGTVYHVDSITLDGKVLFSIASEYLDTPMNVAHGGGIFRSQTLERGSKEEKALQRINKKVLKSFGMLNGVSHSEFIRSEATGEYLFLETSARVCGAHLAEMVEAASGINLWREWAKMEVALARNEAYQIPDVYKKHGGIVVSLSRFESPKMSNFNAEEVWWTLQKKYHIGLVLQADKHERIRALLDEYAEKIAKDFHAQL